MRSIQRSRLLLSAGAAGLLLTALPVGLASVPTTALADSGNGNGHGNGGLHGNSSANGHASVASENSNLGALNAAHASDSALANASPNSRVGRIAAYRDAALAAQTAADTEAAISDALANHDLNNDGVVDATDGTLDFNGDGTVTADDATAEQAEVGALDTNGDGVLNQDDVSNAQAAADTAQDDANAALNKAANKPVTDDVVDAVNHLLGID